MSWFPERCRNLLIKDPGETQMENSSPKQARLQFRKFFLFATAIAIALICQSERAHSQDAVVPPLPPMPEIVAQAELPENAVTQPREGEKTLVDGNWKIQITPQQASRVDVNPKNYEKIYNSIPYRRAEYLANPSYRHDTTVEIMFGQMRPTVVHRQDQPQRIVNPRPSAVNPGGYHLLEYMSYPGRVIRYLPGFGPTVSPIF